MVSGRRITLASASRRSSRNVFKVDEGQKHGLAESTVSKAPSHIQVDPTRPTVCAIMSSRCAAHLERRADSRQTRDRTSMSLRVMTYNVFNGGAGRENLLREVLRAVAPDIVVLQEVFDAAFVGRLADALEMEHFF